MSFQLHEWDIHALCFGTGGVRVTVVTSEVAGPAGVARPREGRAQASAAPAGAARHAELMKTFERLFSKDHRFAERRDPKRRPADAMPVEFVLLGYPVLDSPPLPGDDETGDDPDAGPGG